MDLADYSDSDGKAIDVRGQDAIHAISEYAHTVQLDIPSVLQVLSAAIENLYLAQGVFVNAQVTVDRGEVVVRVMRYQLAQDGFTDFEILNDPLRLTEEYLSNAVESYLSRDITNWRVVMARVTQYFDEGFYMLSSDALALGSDIVVPSTLQGPQGLMVGDTYLVSCRELLHHEWRENVNPHLRAGAKYIGTRSDSRFLYLAAMHALSFLQPAFFRAHMCLDVGLLVFPPNADFGPIIGAQGFYLESIKELCSLRRIGCAYQPPERYDARDRIKFCLRQITGVKGVVSKNPVVIDGFRYWTVRVKNMDDYLKAIGPGGANAILTMQVSRETIQIQVA